MLREIEKLLVAVLENDSALGYLSKDWEDRAKQTIKNIQHRLQLEKCIKLLDNND